MRPAEFTADLRRAGVFPRRTPYTSRAEWQAYRARLWRGVGQDLAIIGVDLALLAALTVGSAWTQRWLFSGRVASPIEQLGLLTLTALAVWTLVRSVGLARWGWHLARASARLPREDAQALVGAIRAQAPGLMRSLVYWEQVTDVPLLRMDRVQIEHGIRLGLFEAGRTAHLAQQRPFDAVDAALSLAWETAVSELTLEA